MKLAIIQNQTGYVNAPLAAIDTGWAISGDYAIHTPCNAGNIRSLTSIGLIVGHQYTISYEVSNRVSGSVRLACGATNGTSRTANGTYTETLLCTTTAQLSFYSDGDLRIRRLRFYDVATGFASGTTITFNEGAKQWGSDQVFHPEIMIKFLDQFLSLKDGNLWLHDSNPVLGNFYGQDYPAEVVFIVNQDYKIDKLFYNLRLNGNGKWYAPSLETPVTNQFPRGMLSRLKKNNVQRIDGKLWAEILKDITDPNFAARTELTALFDARMMQGPWMTIRLKCDDTGSVDLSAVETYYTEVNRTY